MAKSKRINDDMTNRQKLMWANTLLKPFGLVIRSGVKSYTLKQRFDIAGLIARKNDRGRFYIDGDNLLGQVLTEDCFIDDETGEVKVTPKPPSQKFLDGLMHLDDGIASDDE